MNAHSVVRFGTFEFDFASGELRSNGRRIALQGQPTQVLSHLLGRPGDVVTREELRRAIWSDDTFVDFDAALNVAINKIRQALNDSSSAPRFVETVPRRGYRFLADVHVVEPVAAPQPPNTPTVKAQPVFPVQWRWATILIVIVAAAAVWRGLPQDGAAAAPRSVAVLPFRPLVADTRDEALEVGLAEAIIIRFGQLRQLRVPSIHAVRRYVRDGRDPVVAGRDLGVEAVLDGSLLRRGTTVRLSARLLDVKTGTAVWSDQWDFPWTDIFTVQDAMATQVMRALTLTLGQDEERSLRMHPTNVAAYDAYLRARHMLRRRTIEDSRQAATLLEEAVARDPESGAAYASLGFAYISVPLLDGPTMPYMEMGRRAAERALELDPTIAEAHAVLGRILLHFNWDAAASDRASRRALELGPNDPFVLHCYSLIHAIEGRPDAALQLAERALALDPTSIVANRDKATILYLGRRYTDAIAQALRTLELDPHDAAAYSALAQSYEQLQRPDDAIEAHITPLTFFERNRESVAALRAAGRTGGLKAFHRQRLQSLLQDPERRTLAVASAYVRIGDYDRAFEWLEKLYADRGAGMRTLKVNPVWDPIRSDPRFRSLVHRVYGSPGPVEHLSSRLPGSSAASTP